MFFTKRFLFQRLSIAITASAILFSCGQEKQMDEGDSLSSQEDTVMADEESSTVFYALPSPLQIVSIFRKAGLKYSEALPNSFNNASKYSSNMSKSLNLGVYTSDLAYCVLNKRTQEALNYMKVTRKLADELNMSSVFDSGSLGTRFEKNLGNEDSLASILAELQMEIDLFVQDNKREHVSVIAFTGAWIESMYIGSKIYEETKEKNISNKISEQMVILGNLIKALKVHENKDSGITGLISDLNSVKNIYDEIPAVKKSLEEENEEEIVLTETEFQDISKKIQELRAKIING